jgi:LruC domain-containing protein
MKKIKLSKEGLNYYFALLACILMFALQGCKKDEYFDGDVKALASNKRGNYPDKIVNTPAPCFSACLIAGKNQNVGTVDVSVAESGDLLITYNITAPNIYLVETDTDIFSSIEQFKRDGKLSSGGAIPGKFQYKKSWYGKDKMTRYTVVLPKSYVDKFTSQSNCLNISTHAELSNGKTAWGTLCSESSKGLSFDEGKQFHKKNWSVYFEFCLDQCKQVIDYTYAWEDLLDFENDADYNDLVLQADVIKTPSELKLTFLATARGAGFDHQFKIRIPKQGITGIFGKAGEPAPAYTTDGTDYIITVFNSTLQALPPTTTQFYANTVSGSPCTPFAYQEVVLTLDNSFSYNAERPYNPFITVFPSGRVGTGSSYNLSIFELTGQDTWTHWSGKEYPNGILIPKDWRWPRENVAITGPYPNFFNANWADFLADESLTFDKSSCN